MIHFSCSAPVCQSGVCQRGGLERHQAEPASCSVQGYPAITPRERGPSSLVRKLFAQTSKSMHRLLKNTTDFASAFLSSTTSEYWMRNVCLCANVRVVGCLCVYACLRQECKEFCWSPWHRPEGSESVSEQGYFLPLENVSLSLPKFGTWMLSQAQLLHYLLCRVPKKTWHFGC